MKKALPYIAVCIIMMSVLCIAICAVYSSPNLDSYSDTTYYMVEEGDYLWNIVEQNCFSSEEVRNHYDIRGVIRMVESWNDIVEYIYPGQMLKLPYYDK